MPVDKKIYSKRYPTEPEIMELIHTQKSEEEQASSQKSFDEFLHRIETESTYVPMPERIKFSKHFIALAIELSEKYKIDIDVWQKRDHPKFCVNLRCGVE